MLTVKLALMRVPRLAVLANRNARHAKAVQTLVDDNVVTNLQVAPVADDPAALVAQVKELLA